MVDDIRTHELATQRFRINVEMNLLMEDHENVSRFTNNVNDELAKLLTARFNETVGLTHVVTSVFDVTCEEV